MSKEEFEKSYCEKSHITIAEYKEHFITLPCNCGDSSCQGWASVSNNKHSIKAHYELYS